MLPRAPVNGKTEENRIALKQVAQVWDKKSSCREVHRFLSWLDNPFLAQCINEHISGDADKNWLMWFAEKYRDQKGNWGLVLGCGDGGLERHALVLDLCEQFDAFDISPKSIERARIAAREVNAPARIHYHIGDVNRVSLPKKKYDFVFCSMSLHHFDRLEHVFQEVRHSMKSDSLFVFNEYVGPSRFQWTSRQLSIINDLLSILPEHFRRDLSVEEGSIKNEVRRMTVDQMMAVDPSEAVRSEEIIPLVKRHFRIIEKIDYGGTLLHMLLQDIVGNFNLSREEHTTMLKLLYTIEKLLIAYGTIISDFTVVVAEPRGVRGFLRTARRRFLKV